MADRFEALKRAKADGNGLDFWGQSQPRCPHCGEEVDVSDNDLWRIYEEGEHDITCPHCDEDFQLSTRVDYIFSTDDADAQEPRE